MPQIATLGTCRLRKNLLRCARLFCRRGVMGLLVAPHELRSCQWPCELACAIKEELRHRTQRPIFQRDDSDWEGLNSQVDRQHFDRRPLGVEIKTPIA